MAGQLIKIGDQKIPAMWNIDKAGIKAVNSIKSMNEQVGPAKYFSSLPIKCLGKDQCIYRDTCYIDKLDVDPEECMGQVCPIEVELILNLFESYSTEFDLQDLGDKKNTTVIGLLKDLIDTELQIERANKRLMSSGEYLEDRAIGFNERTGEILSNKEINQHILFKEKMQERKAKILNLLHATPKDKAGGDNAAKFTPDVYAAEILKKAKELQELNNEVIDMDNQNSDGKVYEKTDNEKKD